MALDLLHSPCWHVAVAAELVDSAGRPLRRDRPRSLETALREAEASLPPGALAAPLQLEKRGPHWQGLLRRPAALPRLLAGVAERMHPDRTWIGVGFGTVEARVEHGRIRLGGLAFDHARAALWRARKEKRPAVAAGFGSPEDDSIAALLELLEQIRGQWTPKQARSVRLARQFSGKEIATRLGIRPSVVSESLKAASYRSVRRAEDALAALLDHFGTDGPWRGEAVDYPSLVAPVPDPVLRGSQRKD